MLRNKHGSPDGATTIHYVKGEEYDVTESLAKTFVEVDQVAEVVVEPKAEEKSEKPTKDKSEKPTKDK